MKVELTEEQVRNLLILLNRVDIKGSEAVGVVVLRQILEKALEPVPPEPVEVPEESKE